MIRDPKTLAILLAEKARLFRKSIEKEVVPLERGNDFKERLFGEKGLFNLLKRMLIEDLTQKEFVDSYVQTITYGLFLARINASASTLSRKNSIDFIPSSMEIMRELFETIRIKTIPKSISDILEEIIKILNSTEVSSFTTLISKTQKEHDSFVYFYENFLENYDPKQRKIKGVYYTPIPIVWFILNGIEQILTDVFNTTGFSDPSLAVLDFATGTGTFILEVFKRVLCCADEERKGDIIRNHLLKNYHGFECLIAPYAITHLKLSLFLNEQGYNWQSDDRIQVFLTDTLDNVIRKGAQFFPKISLEGQTANKIKLQKKIMVVLGNPPYNDKSRNNKQWILDLTSLYKEGVPKRSWRNLNDDYMKFLCYAQWKIEQNKQGVIGIITNNSFLDGNSHFVMRSKLLETFDQIFILNLHGNTRKGETDENIFDIQIGICIIFLVKHAKLQSKKHVYYFSTLEHNIITRQDKYQFLLDQSTKIFTKEGISWKAFTPRAPTYLFVPKDLTFAQEYLQGIPLLDIFQFYKSGLKTDRDKVSVQMNITKLKDIICDLLDLESEIFRQKYQVGKDRRDWKISEIRESVRQSIQLVIVDRKDRKRYLQGKSIEENTVWQLNSSQDLDEEDWDQIIHRKFVQVQYRPFDYRWLFYDKKKGLISYPRWDLFQHLLIRPGDNIGLAFCNTTPSIKTWQHVFVTKGLAEGGLISSKTSEWTLIAPLYLFRETTDAKKEKKIIQTELSYSIEMQSKTNDSNDLSLKQQVERYKNLSTNFTENFISFLIEKYHPVPSPEDAFSYIYAILNTQLYRKKFLPFLQEGVRILFIRNRKRFNMIAEKGKELIECHLLQYSPRLEAKELQSLAEFPKTGKNFIERISYKKNSNCLMINRSQYFENITPEVWNFKVGGYQVLKKWLNYRKNDFISLSNDEIKLFQKIVRAITVSRCISNEIEYILFDNMNIGY